MKEGRKEERKEGGREGGRAGGFSEDDPENFPGILPGILSRILRMWNVALEAVLSRRILKRRGIWVVVDGFNSNAP